MVVGNRGFEGVATAHSLRAAAGSALRNTDQAVEVGIPSVADQAYRSPSTVRTVKGAVHIPASRANHTFRVVVERILVVDRILKAGRKHLVVANRNQAVARLEAGLVEPRQAWLIELVALC